MNTPFRIALLCLLLAGAGLWNDALAKEEAKADKYLQAVRVFADKVLRHGHDVYGPKQTPLFVDGLNVDTLEPGVWRCDGQRWILSNQASQQNLFRTLVGLSAATGDPKYRQAAADAIAYVFEHLQEPNGLLRWGGHTFYDALGDRVVGEGKNPCHEFKHHYPYYELMWQVNPQATRRLIEGVWQGHVLRWDVLDFNRHSSYRKPVKGDLWESEYVGGKVPFEGQGLTFMMSGTDLAYAAAMLSRFTADERPLVWAKRLAERYMEARDPKTGLGPENFSVIGNPDRMQQQFPQFGGRFSEATVTDLYGTRYTCCAICLLRLGEMLGPAGKEFLQWGLEDLTARASHGYDQATHSFWAMLIDGTKLSPADRKQGGYVTENWLEKRPVDSRHYLAYAIAYKLSKNETMWRMVRSIGQALGLGDLDATAGRPGSINRPTSNSDPLVLFGLLELHEATRDNTFLDAAKKVADNILSTRLCNGFFVESKDHVFTRLDDPAPLALLHLRAAMLKLPEKPPAFWGGKGYFHGPYDGRGRTYDNEVIYRRLRGPNDIKK